LSADSPRYPSRSVAVLIGVWDYTHLPAVPAARHSLDRMRELLTGELCGWPADRVTVVANQRKPDDLHDELIQRYGETDRDAVALFYFVGHGQPDERDRLCLGLADSRAESRRRASTSLRFDDVREALRGCDAGTKIVILDCCFAGLATASQHSLSAGTVLDMTGGTGAYTMAASGAYLPAWFETDPAVDRPQTYFTKYLADVVTAGIPGEPAVLALDRIFARAADRLVRDGRPEPTSTARHAAARFGFARNVRATEEAVRQAGEIEALRAALAAAEAREVELQERYLASDRRVRQLEQAGGADDPDRWTPQRAEAERAVDASAQATAAAHSDRERARDALDEATRQAGLPPEPAAALTAETPERAAQALPVADLYQLILASQQQLPANVPLVATSRPVAEVVRLAQALVLSGRSADLVSMLRLAAQRPVAEVAELATALRGAGEYTETLSPITVGTRVLREHRTVSRPMSEALLLPAARRAVADVVELTTLLRAAGNDGATYLLRVAGWQRPYREVIELAGGLRDADHGSDADIVLERAATRDTDVVVPLIRAAGEGPHAHADLLAIVRGLPELEPGRAEAVRRTLRATMLPAEDWEPRVRERPDNWPRPERTMSVRTEGILMGVQAAVYVPVAFLLGAALSRHGAAPHLSGLRWLALVVTVAVLVIGVGYFVVLLNDLIDDGLPIHQVGFWPGARTVFRAGGWIPLALIVLGVGWALGPALGDLSLTLRDWLSWRF
jgi:hypothetical protein